MIQKRERIGKRNISERVLQLQRQQQKFEKSRSLAQIMELSVSVATGFLGQDGRNSPSSFP